MSDSKGYTIKGKNLLSISRLDLMAKYIYVESVLSGVGIEWAQELYYKHIEAFSGGSFKEPQNDNKNSYEAYILSFNELIESIVGKGFDSKISTIPVSPNGIILDGAHRVAIAAYLDLDVSCITEERYASYGFEFFNKMHLEQKYIDAMATKYVEIKGENCYVICIWPKAYKDKQNLNIIDKMISDELSGKVLCKKDIHITYQGLRNLMIQCYEKHEWCGDIENHYSGVEGKVNPCFDDCKMMRTYIVEMDSPDSIISLKARIRGVFGLDNHSVHSSDNYEETLLLTRILYNENCIYLLNNGIIDYDICLVNRLREFRKTVIDGGYRIEDFIVDSSSVLGLFGIRKPKDLDYISLDGISLVTDSFDNHIQHASFYNHSIDELIANPTYYLYAYGVKLITLDVLRDYKNNRKEQKDLDDIKLINRKMSHSFSLSSWIDCTVVKGKRVCGNIKTKIRIFLEKHHVNFLTKTWHFIKGKGFR